MLVLLKSGFDSKFSERVDDEANFKIGIFWLMEVFFREILALYPESQEWNCVRFGITIRRSLQCITHYIIAAVSVFR